MTPNMWLFSAIVGLLTAALSGHPSPAPSDQSNTSYAESPPLEPGQQLGVRLVNGSSHCGGTVEVWLGLSWEPACGAFWDSWASEAVCRALGCGGAWEATPPALPSLEPPPGPGAGNTSEATNATLTLAPAVRCTSAEWQLCKVVEHACDRNETPAKVTCAENRAVRLVGGSSRCAGRVEVLEYGQWGSVCDDTWDLEDSHVVCRQLNCGWAVQALPGLHFAPGRGPIYRDQVNCSGAESYLWDCPGLPGDGYCGHKEDAGVVCSEHQSWRLTGGRDSCEGQVEVQFRGVWSTVCNSEWYAPEAHVLCRALGCGTMVGTPSGLPHSLPGRMYYSCTGDEPTLADCSWRFNNSNLCSQSSAARVLCSGSRSLLNLSTPEVPASVQPVTVESSVTVETEDWKSRELVFLILCVILGILVLGLLIFVAVILLKVKGKYDSQRHRLTEEEIRQNRFQMPLEEGPMPPLEEGLEETRASQIPPVGAGHYTADTPLLGSQHHPRSSSGSSTSSGEDYCNRPSSGPAPWAPPVFSTERSPLLEQPPNLELAGSQGTFSAGPSADDSSSTSSGEWYQNFQPPPQPPSMEQLECPGAPTLQPDSMDSEEYDDIGAA
ncbi:T-cell differentiation antigen CD6 isoform X4 [Ursus maritimus]|uniref:T-cell differentiation antigen CD6 n=1 Tax=Ursus maritimus TaxID=29073 RepID=A0A8M1GK33_URSMA|nr:T-cell differentiation antigen CD6 isoform X4 [Ursus maritimus]